MVHVYNRINVFNDEMSYHDLKDLDEFSVNIVSLENFEKLA